MANFNVTIRKSILILLLLLFNSPVFSVKLFYLSTDRTFSETEVKKVKVESGYLDDVDIRVYKINDTYKYFLSQEDFHRPKVEGRKFRFITSDVLKGFKNSLKTDLRSWARNNMPAQNREKIIESYSDLGTLSDERYFRPSKKVDYITDKNFTLVREKRYVFENRNRNWNTNYIYFNDLEPGTYLIEGITGEKLAYTILNVSEFSFITKKAGNDLQVYAVNSLTGEPEKNIKITVYDRFRNKLANGKTDKNGIEKFKVKSNDIFIFAENDNGSYSFYDPRYYPATISDNKVYIYTNRPVYKGGDEVNVKGLLHGIKEYKNITLDLYNNNGSILTNIDVVTEDNRSFYSTFNLPEEAPKGRYRVVVTIDEKFYEAEFKVEYYTKPEFKLKIKPQQKTYLSGNEVIFDLSAEYYSGGAVQNLDVDYVISRTRYNFKEIPRDDFASFLSQQEWEYTGIEKLSDGSLTLDDEGRGVIKFKVGKNDLKDPYIYRVMATVKNNAGANVVANGSTKVVYSNIRFGLNTHKFVYNKGENITLLVDVTDYDRNPLEKELEVEIYTKTGNKRNILKREKIKTGENGQAEYNFKTKEPGLLYFDVSSKDTEGNINTNSKSVWIGEEGVAYSVSGGFVKLILDQKYYSVGDTAKLLIVSPIADIPMLLSIEGSEILSSEVTRLTENSAYIDIPVKETYLPNAFVTVDFIYENRHYSNTIKLDVPPLEKFLNIEIISNNSIVQPDSKESFKVRVTDHKGNRVKETDLSIGVVDEAVYAISADLTVDIRSFFYHFKRNNVMTWTSSGFRFYGYAYSVKRELASKFYKDATGIAAFKGADEEDERREFKDAILWLPSIKTDENGEADFNVEFPSNITSWRFTTIGRDNSNRVGIDRFNIISKKEVFANISTPVMVGENDKTSAFIKVFNDTDKTRDLRVSSKLINLNGIAIKEDFTLKPYSTETFFQEFYTDDNRSGEISVIVEEGDRVFDYTTISLEKKDFSLDKNFVALKDLTFVESSMNFSLPNDMTGGINSFNITLIGGLAGHIINSLDYLAIYPHGCAEQTTNRFLPNISAVAAFDNAGIPLSHDREKLDKHVIAGVSRLAGFQNTDGSWGWMSDSNPNIYMSAYVLYGLTMARDLDYNINSGIMTKGLNFLKSNIHKANGAEKLFGLYVLALNGERIDSVYSSIHTKYLSDYELALYILVNKELGMSNDSLVKELMNNSKKDGKLIYWGNTKSRNWSTNHIETTAWVIKALSTYIDYNELLPAVDYLIDNKKGDIWNSTRDTSAVIVAISDFISSDKKQNRDYQLLLNNEVIDGVDLSEGVYRNKINLEPELLKKDNKIKIKGLKTDVLTALVNIKYTTKSYKIHSSGFKSSIKRRYYKLNRDLTLGQETDSFKKGDNIVVELDYQQDEYNEYIMLTDHLPAGCLYNRDISSLDIVGINAIPVESINPQNGKVYFYYTDAGNKKIYYVISAVYPGSYSVNPAVGELMYFPEVMCNSSSNEISITGER